MPEFACLVILVLNGHGIMSEECDQLFLGLDECRMR